MFCRFFWSEVCYCGSLKGRGPWIQDDPSQKERLFIHKNLIICLYSVYNWGKNFSLSICLKEGIFFSYPLWLLYFSFVLVFMISATVTLFTILLFSFLVCTAWTHSLNFCPIHGILSTELVKPFSYNMWISLMSCCLNSMTK